jgi:uncharacterized membrane protein YeaQ/YmgE (transglycosylase-associated protein family)
MLHISLRTINVADVLQPGNVIAWLLVGLIAGAFAGLVVRGRGFGCIGDIIIGLIGSLIGAILDSSLDWGQLHFCGSVFVSFLGAVILVAILEFLTGGFDKKRKS